MFRILLALVILIAVPLSPRAWAQETPPQRREGTTGLPVPRFVSLKTTPAHLREGPSASTQIRWVYVRKSLPVEILEEYEHWRKVRDPEGEIGWMHKEYLGATRTVVITGTSNAVIHEQPDTASRPVAYGQPGLVARLKSCNAAFCEISARGYSGWVERAQIWGVYPDETP